MTEYRRNEYDVLSQFSHLSYIAAGMASLVEEIKNEGHCAVGVFGAASTHSYRTVHYAMFTTWYFSRMINPVILGKETGKYVILLNRDDEWHQKMWVASKVLSEIMLEHSSENTGCNSSQIGVSEHADA